MTTNEQKCPVCGGKMEHATFVNDEEFFQCLITSCIDGIYSRDDLDFIQSRITAAVIAERERMVEYLEEYEDNIRRGCDELPLIAVNAARACLIELINKLKTDFNLEKQQNGN